MALTLTAGIAATDRTIAVTGTVPADIGQGFEFRLGEELLVLTAFALHNVQHVNYRSDDPNPQSWLVRRGLNGTTPATHAGGTTIRAAVDAFASGAAETPPSVFAEGGGGSVTPAGFVEPTTATPEEIVNALIAASLMDAS